MANLATIAAVVSIAGGVVSGIGSLQAGAAEKEGNYEAANQLEQQGRGEFAAAQRDALEAKYQSDLVISRQIAVAAASGGGARGTPTVMKILDETGSRAQQLEESIIYKGLDTRQRYYAAAKVKRISGDASLIGSVYSGAGYALGGIGAGIRSLN